ncbi:HemK methyltransferase family member 2 [Eumeta japonica]|uniref:Methyltransferase HEMK2 n=1 Tax=Eumeta variegata TaxID=151549 RepID=A0A4C1X230_EUMVA|nr:HemK methyltransferase family member 2 [Eumeta japonica]
MLIYREKNGWPADAAAGGRTPASKQRTKNVVASMDDTESTTTSADENTGNLLDNPTRDTLAEGLLGLLKPCIDQLDDRVRATRISQLELRQQIESLNEELMKVREALNAQPDLELYVKKLIACKHKITVVLNILQASQDRLNDLRRSVGLEKGVRTAILTGSDKIEPEQGPSAEDSFLLIDALEQDLSYLKTKNPAICLEIGSGSGIIVTAFGMAFQNCFCLSTDINFKACLMTHHTASHNGVPLDSVNMDLGMSFVNNKFDVIIFNPPYVVTESSECGVKDISASWAGGAKGREVTDRLLHEIPKMLADDGVFYLLLIKENIPGEVVNIMFKLGYRSNLVIGRRVRNEHQLVYKFYK